MQHFLDFERPIAILENKLNELRNLDSDTGLNSARNRKTSNSYSN